jgi:hypothetical protein
MHNQDAVCFTSALICLDAFMSLQDRPVAGENYEPPMEWLAMARGASSTFRFSTCDNKDARVQVLVRANPFLSNLDVLFAEKNRSDYLYILRQDISDDEAKWYKETQSAYEDTLSYLGSIQQAQTDGEHILGVTRRLSASVLLIPRVFIGFVEEKRPRALVVLAHYFSLLVELESLWWIGKAGRREIVEMQRHLPAQWQELIRGPVEKAGLNH